MSILEVGSPEWRRTPTPSKIPAILGLSRWQSPFACWHEMAGLVESEPISEQKQELFDYGHAVELAAREFWLRRNPGWRASRGEVQYSRTDIPGIPHTVATIDLRASRGKARRIVEVKTARSAEEWGDDGSGVVPNDYAAQVLWQMFVSQIHEADIVLWPQYGMPEIYPIEWNSDVANAIAERVAAWQQTLVDRTPPPNLDNTVATYECLRRLHPDIERDLEVEIDPKLAIQFLDWTSELKATEKSARGVKSQLLAAMGNAQYATCLGHKIADRRNHASGRVALVANPKTDILHTLKEIA